MIHVLGVKNENTDELSRNPLKGPKVDEGKLDRNTIKPSTNEKSPETRDHNKKTLGQLIHFTGGSQRTAEG